MKLLLSFLVVLSAMVLSACSNTAYSVRVVNKETEEIYITYGKGADLKVGDVFAIYRLSVVEGGGGGHNHGGSSQHIQKELIGSVRVTQIVDKQTAAVKITAGNVEDGLVAEKVQ